MAIKSNEQQQNTSSHVLTEIPVTARAADPAMRLPVNHPFRYWIDPLRVQLIDGKAHFNPVAVEVRPGVQGVPDNGDPSTIDGYQSNQCRRIPVPLDTKVTAWGEERDGYMVRTQIGTDRRGQPLYHYHDVWTRYRMVGSRVQRDFDAAGWLAFCRQCEQIASGSPDPAAVESERARLMASRNEHLRQARTQPAAEAAVAELDRKLGLAKPEQPEESQLKTGRRRAAKE